MRWSHDQSANALRIAAVREQERDRFKLGSLRCGALVPNKKPRPHYWELGCRGFQVLQTFPIGGAIKVSTVRRRRKIGNLGQSVVGELLHTSKFALSTHAEKMLF